MKRHKVKLIGVRGDVIDLKVDGVKCSYLAQHPLPLSVIDTTMLKNVFDRGLAESVVRPLKLERGLLERFLGLWRRKGAVIPVWLKTPNEAAADYLEKFGIEVDLDGTKCFVIRRSDLDKIREGKLE